MSANWSVPESQRQRPRGLPRQLAESFRAAVERATDDEGAALRRWVGEHGRELGLEERCPTKVRPDGRTVLACPRDCPCDGAGHYLRTPDWNALLHDIGLALGPAAPPAPAPAAARARPALDDWMARPESRAEPRPATDAAAADFTWPVASAGEREMFSQMQPRRRWFGRRAKAPKPRSFDPGPTWFERLLWMFLVAAAIGLGVFFYWHS